MSTSAIGSSDPFSSAYSSLPGNTNMPSAAALAGMTDGSDPSTDPSTDPTTDGASGSSSTDSSTSTDSGLAGITPDDFLQMLITELQNQDPMNPTDSDQIMQQISEIRNIQATSDLTSTLSSVALGQSL
ncbi:MAG TPA: flagellar hook capping FlgD N-terminal domain-containing protein, partial [Pirellulales bacterium]|nr:flagellar hook capping FlgD N-terminal domain-containing protein [Pirellulales bacterium]